MRWTASPRSRSRFETLCKFALETSSSSSSSPSNTGPLFASPTRWRRSSDAPGRRPSCGWPGEPPMSNLPVWLSLCASLSLFPLLVWVLRRTGSGLEPFTRRLEAIERAQERTERAVREEIARNREETTGQARLQREEPAATLKEFGESVGGGVAKPGESNELR